MKYNQKDAIEAFENNEINVCLSQSNCEGLNYFAGFAKKLHQKYPELTKMHQEHCKNEDVFGTIRVYQFAPTKGIINLYSQKYRGSPNNSDDNIDLRIEALHICLKEVNNQLKGLKEEYSEKLLSVGLPLIASGLAADKQRKGTMTDLEYFKKYIAPIVEEELKDLDVTVYYL